MQLYFSVSIFLKEPHPLTNVDVEVVHSLLVLGGCRQSVCKHFSRGDFVPFNIAQEGIRADEP